MFKGSNCRKFQVWEPLVWKLFRIRSMSTDISFTDSSFVSHTEVLWVELRTSYSLHLHVVRIFFNLKPRLFLIIRFVISYTHERYIHALLLWFFFSTSIFPFHLESEKALELLSSHRCRKLSYTIIDQHKLKNTECTVNQLYILTVNLKYLSATPN